MVRLHSIRLLAPNHIRITADSAAVNFLSVPSTSDRTRHESHHGRSPYTSRNRHLDASRLQLVSSTLWGFQEVQGSSLDFLNRLDFLVSYSSIACLELNLSFLRAKPWFHPKLRFLSSSVSTSFDRSSGYRLHWLLRLHFLFSSATSITPPP